MPAVYHYNRMFTKAIAYLESMREDAGGPSQLPPLQEITPTAGTTSQTLSEQVKTQLIGKVSCGRQTPYEDKERR